MIKLHNAQDAIKQAIEGGYHGGIEEKIDSKYCDLPEPYNYAHMCTDPLFWQALGKARGWQYWKREALCYFDVRLSERDENKFWESLP